MYYITNAPVGELPEQDGHIVPSFSDAVEALLYELEEDMLALGESVSLSECSDLEALQLARLEMEHANVCQRVNQWHIPCSIVWNDRTYEISHLED